MRSLSLLRASACSASSSAASARNLAAMERNLTASISACDFGFSGDATLLACAAGGASVCGGGVELILSELVLRMAARAVEAGAVIKAEPC
eukprot:2595-Heterococcus_DN1.PRE.2